MKKLIVPLVVIFVLISCENKGKIKQIGNVKLTMSLEKIIVVKLNEVCVTFFKVKINNKSNSSVIMLDNSLSDWETKTNESKKKGFYLFKNGNNLIKPLSILGYSYVEILPNSNNFYFIGAKNLNNTFKEKDSLLFKESLLGCSLVYNGKALDLLKVKKSKYISQKDYDSFVKRRKDFIPYKDSLSILIRINNIKLKYLKSMPTTQEEWNNL